MADNIVVRRGIKLYIDNVEIDANIKSVKAQMKSLTNEQSKMTIGSDEYVRHAQKIKELDKIVQDHKKTLKSVDDQLKDTGGSLTKWQVGIAGFMGGLATKAADLVEGAFRNIGEFIKSSIENWDEAAQSEKKLQVALKGREDILPGLMENAAKLQDEMNVPHEVIEGQEAFLAAQGRTEDQIKKTMKAAIQMAAVVPGMDLQSAVKQLDSSYSGVLRGLNRLDPAFKSLTKEQLLNGAAVDLINEKYQGFAEAAAKEGLGPLKQLNLVWTDIKENLGGMFAKALLPLANGFLNVATGIRSLTGASDRSVVSLEDQRVKVNMLASQIMEANTPLNVRKKLYDELESLAPSILNGINKESTSYEKLRSNLASYNNEMINRIVIQRKQVELDKQNEDVADKLEKKQKIEDDIRNSMAKAISSSKSGNADYYKVLLSTVNNEKLTLEEKVNELYKAQSKYLNIDSGTWWGYILQLKKATDDYNKELDKSNDILKEKERLKKDLGITDLPENTNSKSEAEKAAAAEELKYAKMTVEQLQEILDNSEDEKEKTLVKAAIKIAKTREDKNKKEQEDLKKHNEYLLKIQTLYEEASAQAFVASRDREVAAEEAAAHKKLAEITGHTQKEEETRIAIKQASSRKIVDINNKYSQLETEHYLQLEKEKADRKLGIIADYQPQYLQLAIRFIEIERDIELNNDKLTVEERNTIYEKFLKKKLDTEKAYGDARMRLVYSDLNNEVSRYRAQQILDDANEKYGYENKKKLLEKEYNLRINQAIEAGQSTLDIDSQYYADKKRLSEDYYSWLSSKVQQYGQMATDAIKSYDQIKQNQEKRELDAATADNDKKKALLKKQLDSKLISQTDYDNKVAKLDADLDKKKRKIDHDQAVRAKEMSIFDAMINIALAILKALPTPWMIPIVSALGALQLAAIISTPVPAYKDGGFTNGDKMYRAGEKGKEYIAPNDQVDDPITGPIIRMLNNVRIGKLSKNALLRPATPAFSALQNAAGSASQSSSTMIIQQVVPPADNQVIKDQHETIKLLASDIKQLKEYMSDPNNRRATINRDLLTKFDKEEAKLRELAQFKG